MFANQISQFAVLSTLVVATEIGALYWLGENRLEAGKLLVQGLAETKIEWAAAVVNYGPDHVCPRALNLISETLQHFIGPLALERGHLFGHTSFAATLSIQLACIVLALSYCCCAASATRNYRNEASSSYGGLNRKYIKLNSL